jgi:hypothetical protein
LHILFDDLIQYSNAPEQLKMPYLTVTMENQPFIFESLDGGYSFSSFDEEIEGGDAYAHYDETLFGGAAYNTREFEIDLQEPSTINCVGAGNTDGEYLGLILVDTSDSIYYEDFVFNRNGLYMLQREYTDIKQIRLAFSGKYIGRIGTGRALELKTSIPKEPTLMSTASPRITLSGQSILGLGGYNYWRISVDTRYKLTTEDFNTVIKAWPFLSTGYPMFVSFDTESKLPLDKMYANDTNQQDFGFESSINKHLYSRKFIFEERF